MHPEMLLDGSCHCSAIQVAFETALAIEALPVRQCGCTFCLKHRPRYTTDARGSLILRLACESSAIRYRFGLKLADFILCSTCGVFVAAVEPATAEPSRTVDSRDVAIDATSVGVSEPGSTNRLELQRGRAVLNLATLDRSAEFVAAPTLFTEYDSEDVAARTARRARVWTPATVVVR